MVTSSVDSSTFGRAQHANMPLHNLVQPRLSSMATRTTTPAHMTPTAFDAFAAPRARASNAPGIAASRRGVHDWTHLGPATTGGVPRRLSFATRGASLAPLHVASPSFGAVTRLAPATEPSRTAKQYTLRAQLRQLRDESRLAQGEASHVGGLTDQTADALTEQLVEDNPVPISEMDRVSQRMAILEARLSSIDAENASLRAHVNEAHATIEALIDEKSDDGAASESACNECSAENEGLDIDTSHMTSHEDDRVTRVLELMPDASLTISEKELTLSSDDLKSMRTTAKLAVLRAWLLGFPARVGQKHPLLQLCITVNNDDWMIMLRHGALSFSSADVRFANRMLSRNINNALDSTSAAVRSIRRHMESNSVLFSDGRALFAYLWTRVENKSGVSVRLTVRAFEAKIFFTLTMDSDEVEEAIEQIAADLQELPLEYSARAYAVYYYAITKLPDAIASDREEFLSDFYDGQEKERLP